MKHAVAALFALVALCGVSNAQTISPPPYLTILDSNGAPVSGCLVEVYQAGTVVPATTWSDAALTVPNPWPAVCDSAGRVVIFLASGQSVKYTIKTAAGVVIKTVDSIQSTPLSTGNLDVPGVAGEALSAGDVVYLSGGSGGLVAGKWYKADADNTYSSTLPTVGMAPAAIALNATGTIRLAGRVEDLPAMVVGSTYYISAAAGGMTAVAPANARLLGSADTVTSVVLQINTPATGLPTGFVGFFNLAACPVGWSELVAARGRYLVGMPAAGTLAGTQGTALSDLENRAVGQHTHTDNTLELDVAGTGAAAAIAAQRGDSLGGQYNVGITIGNAGAVAGTNAPFIQFLVCVKS